MKLFFSFIHSFPRILFLFLFSLLFLHNISFAEENTPIILSNTTQGSSHIFMANNDENKNFTLSHSYTSIAVKTSASTPIILVSNNDGENWYMLNFNRDSKTERNETDDSQFLYSDLLFFNTPSQQFLFKTKLLSSSEHIPLEFIFINDNPLEHLNASTQSETTEVLGYTRDTSFFRKNGIITREEWGANETYRYAKSQTPTPPPATNTTTAPLSKRAQECNTTYTNNPQDFIKAEEVYSDQNGKLRWQYQYSPEIKKIIIHHTGTNNAKYSGQSDEEVLRATYKYHANIKGWGDIGYNFLISKNGAIYEGRAGGDFIIGGHAYCANTQTLGIALMGNYEDETMNTAQMAALQRLITGLSEKYHINPYDNSYFLGKTTPNLIGHKDYGNTLCPGKNVYKYLQTLRETFAHKSFGDTPAYYNPYSIPEYITPTLPLQLSTTPLPTPIQYSPASLIQRPTIGDVTIQNATENTPSTSPLPTPLPQATQKPHLSIPERDIRIKLSFSSDLIQIKGTNMNVSINNTAPITQKRQIVITARKNSNNKLQLYRNNTPIESIKIENKNNTEPLKIASWSRPLPWAPHLHDNLFLGALEIRILDNTVVIINELPLEDYIKGIAEVSNTAPFEKQKVLAVIARTYAQFYMQENQQKFPNMPYDGDDNPDHFQKYRGYGYQIRSPRFSQAVDATQSEVVSYNGKIIKTPFFSESAGRTLSAQEKWGWTHTPYLQSVNDVFCKNGQGELKGHGVGLSGCGAETMALRGFSYKDIIKYYYKNVEIY